MLKIRQSAVFKSFSTAFEFASRRRPGFAPMALALCLFGLACGCGRLHRQPPEMVYVSVNRVFLRERVAPVARRVVEVVNGEPLTVMEHDSRYLKVKTAGGEVGWIEGHEVIDAKTYDAFQQLAAQGQGDPVEAEASLRDELYMHVQPGRETERFYLLPKNSKVELLERASVSKTPQPSYAPLAKLAEPKSAPSGKGGAGSSAAAGGPGQQPAPAMEDWWLARDSKGRTGWLLGSRLDTNVPEAIEGYGAGMRFAGAWRIAEVTDPEADTPDHMVPEYVTALTPYQSGLPYDFDQIRVYTWSLRHHRYETAFRLRIEGYLPVRITSTSTPRGDAPVFSFEIAGAKGVVTNFTGITRPVAPRTLSYELLDTYVRRIGPDLAPIEPTRAEHRRR
jgi:hypothetical protein